MQPTWMVRGRPVVGELPAVMGIVNASPESFSGDARSSRDEQVEQVRSQFAAGALIVDIGGQSANTKTPELAVAEEIERIVPLIEQVRAAGIDGLLSIDTYKPAVADACLRAGADVINDVSALHHPELIDVLVEHDAGLVLMHTVGPPKVKILEDDLYDDVVAEVHDFAIGQLERLEAAGLRRDRVCFDPGVDFAKTPRQSVDLLHRVAEFGALERPVLLALSRKDFIGTITETTPRQRDAGTLASVGFAAAALPSTIFRVHDVAATVHFLQVLRTLQEPELLQRSASLAEHLRREPV